jgi:glycosyltransferase involved in cell wall biosynthesis
MSLTYDFDVIIEAASMLPDQVFLFAGGGSKAEAIETQVKVRGLSNVIFTGVLPHSDMPSIWAIADACIIALGDHSVAGGTLPAKMYEALATGTPIVAAIRGEGAAMIKQAGAGMIVPIADANAMANAVKTLADESDLRARMSHSARAFAEANLSPTRVKDAYFSIFQSVTNS